ncbi:prefoldin subunit 1 [Exophiala aquamarina CBS 119918]|uniref:Prefoldin subunit 1 n=1 Tax=Exophiala aquamarina CBS 119918 TaxID=1182545 RepID=A0A072PEH5_9EURO|nr:prefoldin subunit 1 [Exophiala aquamarina CBS 119918]KEF53960.1 prefoldin subunit 1 [Exophiala aquamarina CBS 119918]
MAIPNAALQKLLQEVETQAVLSQQKITQTQAELGAKRRDARLNHLTSNELKSLSKDTNVYEGVGKIALGRFVAVPITTLNQRLHSESTTLNKEIADLEKRLHYQETTYKNSRSHIEKILQTGSRP